MLTKKSKKPKKGYWYKFFYQDCVLCGRENRWKERQYTEPPKDSQDRHEHRDYACDYHFM